MYYTVNIDDIEISLRKAGGEAFARDIQTKVLEDFCNGEIPNNYKSERSFRQTIQRKIEDYCPQAEGFERNEKPIKFLRIGHGLYRLAATSEYINTLLPEEVDSPGNYKEGSTKEISVNYYERNPEARQACIDHYGLSCVVCGFNFKEVYGEVGINFIHVHHLRPLSTIGEDYEVNPIEDLRPVCPNCHAMLHRKKELMTIAELKNQLTSQASGTP
jgi:hypothetical protein